MPEDNHDRWLGMAALSALGALPTEESADFAAHLTTCRRCEKELFELRAIAGVIREVPMGETSSDPPDKLKESVVWAVRGARRSQHRYRRMTTSIAGAAAAIALVAVGVALPTPGGPPQEVLTVATTSTDVDAQASLVAHTWGTEVKLVVTGLDHGQHYRVALIDTDGDRIPAGTFIGVSDRPIVCDMNAAVMRPDATRMEIVSRDGAVVASADLARR